MDLTLWKQMDAKTAMDLFVAKIYLSRKILSCHIIFTHCNPNTLQRVSYSILVVTPPNNILEFQQCN